MTDTKCLDSSAWLAYYFAESIEMKNIIDSESSIVTSSISLFEIKKRLKKAKKDYETFLTFLKKRSSVIIAPGIILAENAADVSIDHGLGAVDSLIYATAQFADAELITADNDFRELDNVKIIS